MEDFSDKTNCFIVLICYTLYHFYLMYRQTQLKMSRGFNNINCRPISMVIGGIIDEDQASKTFSSCMEYASAEKTRKAIDDAKNKYDKNMTEIVDDISNNMYDENVSNQQKQQKLFEFVNQKSNSVNDLVSQQQKMNSVIQGTSGPIKDMMSNLQNITTQLKDVFTSFQNNISNS